MTTHDGQGMLKACDLEQIRKLLWTLHGRVDYMPKSNRNMGVDLWKIKTFGLLREAIDLATVTRTTQPSVATEGEVERREDHWRKWPQGDAGDAIDFACDVIMTGSFGAMSFLEQWREGRADEWPEYMHWLKVQRDGARAAIAQVPK